MLNKDTRFFSRKAHLIRYEDFIEVMQEMLDDRTIEIENDYEVLSVYSPDSDCAYDEEEILMRIGTHLGVTLITSVKFDDLEVIYFMEDK